MAFTNEISLGRLRILVHADMLRVRMRVAAKHHDTPCCPQSRLDVDRATAAPLDEEALLSNRTMVI